MMGGTTQTPVFALEIERSKNNTKHIMERKMDLISSSERQTDRQTDRQTRIEKYSDLEREGIDKIKLQMQQSF